jgi:acyl-CoA synthetase (AMP-forming)/AMP-acid ligase II
MIFELLKARANDTPDNVAVCAPGRTDLTYRALINQIEVLTHALTANGVDADSPVAIVLPNGPEMAVAILGTIAIAVCAPLNPASQT